MLGAFLSFSSWGRLPSGSDTHFPILTGEESMLMAQPYSSWTLHQQDGKIHRPIDRLQARLGFGGPNVGEIDSSRLAWTTADILAMKARVFQGMVPISGETWARKQLDDPENVVMACEYLSLVVRVFQFLNSVDVQTKLRDSFNLISSDLKDFDFALMMKRQEQGLLPVSSAALWAEYIHDLFSFITTRAHSWVLDRVRGLYDMYVADFLSVSEEEDGYIPHAVKFMQRTRSILQVMATADCAIILPMDGYTGYRSRPPGPDPGYEARVKTYVAKTDAIPVVDEIVEMAHAYKRNMAHPGDQEKFLGLLAQEEEVRAQVRKEIRGTGERRLGPEMWISSVESEMHHYGADSWGFVAYRLSYKETDEEFASFLTKLDSDISNWGEWVEGAEEIKAKARLHWVDGKSCGIPEGDVKAAKRFGNVRNYGQYHTNASQTLPRAPKLCVLPSWNAQRRFYRDKCRDSNVPYETRK
jgi:hypothetical protein